MTTPAHVLSAAYLALVATGVEPSQTATVLSVVAGTAILDLDHLYFVVRDRSVARPGQLHRARSFSI